MAPAGILKPAAAQEGLFLHLWACYWQPPSLAPTTAHTPKTVKFQVTATAREFDGEAAPPLSFSRSAEQQLPLRTAGQYDRCHAARKEGILRREREAREQEQIKQELLILRRLHLEEEAHSEAAVKLKNDIRLACEWVDMNGTARWNYLKERFPTKLTTKNFFGLQADVEYEIFKAEKRAMKKLQEMEEERFLEERQRRYTRPASTVALPSYNIHRRLDF